MLSSILLAIAGAAHYAWVLLLLLIPQVLDLLKPAWESLWNGFSNLVSTIWQGAKSANFNVWMLVLAASVIAGSVGYYYGWHACIDWVHAHYRLITKVSPTSWWKFW